MQHLQIACFVWSTVNNAKILSFQWWKNRKSICFISNDQESLPLAVIICWLITRLYLSSLHAAMSINLTGGVMWCGWSSEFRWLLFFLVVSLIRDQRRPEGWSHSTFHTRGWKCSQKADLEQMGTTLNMINRETFLNTLTDIMISLKCHPIIRWSLKSERFSTECLIWFFHSGRLKIWYKIPKLFSLKTLLWLWINRLQMFVGSKVIVLFISV